MGWVGRERIRSAEKEVNCIFEVQSKSVRARVRNNILVVLSFDLYKISVYHLYRSLNVNEIKRIR